MRQGLVLSAIFAAACSGGGAGGSSAGTAADPATPAADPAPCSAVAAHELQVMGVGFLGPDKVHAMTATIERHCTADAWPTDARRCIVTATAFDEMSACEQQLTPAQRDAYHRDAQPADAGDAGAKSQPPPELLE